MDRTLGWVGAAAGLGGSLILAIDLQYAPLAFAVWFLSNFVWVAHSWRTGLWSQGMMQVGYAVINTVGVYRYFGPGAGIGAGFATLGFLWLIGRGLHGDTSGRAEWGATRTLGWIGCASGLLGSLIVALALGGERWGFPVWVLSNSAWLAHAWRTRVWAQAGMQVGYFGINALALSNYFGPLWGGTLLAYLLFLLIYLYGVGRRAAPSFAA